MVNYRHYQPYRPRYRTRNRRWTIVVWVGVAIVLVILIRNGLGGSSDSDKNKNDDVTLASGTSANANVPVATPAIEGDELTTKACTKALSRSSVDKPFVALTLDGGGIPGDALKVLDTIKQKQVAVTLFVTGKWAEDQAEIVKAYSEAGIDVFNHSYEHTSYPDLTAEKIATDLEKAEIAIVDVTGKSTKPYFRPPFGDVNDTVMTELRRLGYCAILWTVDALDWQNEATVESAKARVLERLRNGAIILVQANSDIAADLVGPLVDEVRGKGFTFMSVRDLLRQAASSSEGRNTNSD